MSILLVYILFSIMLELYRTYLDGSFIVADIPFFLMNVLLWPVILILDHIPEEYLELTIWEKNEK